MTEDEMLDGISDSMDMSLNELWGAGDGQEGRPGVLQSMGLQSWTGLSD